MPIASDERLQPINSAPNGSPAIKLNVYLTQYKHSSLSPLNAAFYKFFYSAMNTLYSIP
jgi:hypothetical protein